MRQRFAGREKNTWKRGKSRDADFPVADIVLFILTGVLWFCILFGNGGQPDG